MSNFDKLTEEERMALAQVACENIVKHWESIDERADKLQREFGLDDETRNKIAEDFRSMIGGEELYLEAKHYLAEQGT